MEKTIELYAFFLLTVLGFIIPTLAILFSLFSDGLAKLFQQYETERNQTEKRLSAQLQKAGGPQSDAGAVEIDLIGIRKTIRELESVKKTANKKLRLLAPKKAILRLALPLFLAFVAILPSFFQLSLITYLLDIASLFLLGYLLIQFWKLLQILVEVKAILDIESKNEQRRVPDLLAEIASNTKKGAAYFLEKVYIKFNGVKLIKDVNEVALAVDKKIEVTISLVNLDSRMAKDVEAGFRFPTEFLIEKSQKYSIYTGGDEQIVRYSLDRLHGDTDSIMSPLVLTPLKKGEYEFKTFIKGENIESKYRSLKIKVE
jgi:hypothetical protein